MNKSKIFKNYYNSQPNRQVKILSCTKKKLIYKYPFEIMEKEYSDFDNFIKFLIKSNQEEIKFLKSLIDNKKAR